MMARGKVTKKTRSNGKVAWQARIDMGTDAGGRRLRRAKEFDTKRQADEQLTAWRTELSAGILAPRTHQTTTEYLYDWLASKRGTVARSTHEEYTWQMEKQVMPHLGSVPLEKLTTAQIERWRDMHHARGLKPRGVNAPLALLKMALARAVLIHVLTRNPAEHVAFIRDRKVPKSAWQMADMHRFLAGAEDDPLYAAWLLAMTTGMRRGELAGLRWQDVDLDGGVLRVRNAIALEGSKPDDDVPKSAAGVRLVSIRGAVRTALIAHATKQADRADLAPAVRRSGYVFTTRTGKPYHPDYLSHAFPRLCARIKVPHIPLHSLRNAAIALAVASGRGDIKTISRRVGHSRSDVTMEVYAYSLLGQDEAVAEGVDALLFGSRPPGAHPDGDDPPSD